MINPLERGPRAEVTLEAGDVVILCEGLDDCAVVSFLTRTWTRRPKIGTKDERSKWSWGDEFRQLARQAGMHGVAAIGLVFDAEMSASKQETGLRRECEAAGLDLPADRSDVRTVEVGGVELRLGYHLNPDGHERGSVENLFLSQIERSAEWPCIRDLLACLDRMSLSSRHPEKTILRTFVARQRPHNTGLRIALDDGILNCEGSEFDGLKRFLDKLRTESAAQTSDAATGNSIRPEKAVKQGTKKSKKRK